MQTARGTHKSYLANKFNSTTVSMPAVRKDKNE